MLISALLFLNFAGNIFPVFSFSLVHYLFLHNIFDFAELHLVLSLPLFSPPATCHPLRSFSHELLYILMADDSQIKNTFWYLHLNMQLYLSPLWCLTKISAFTWLKKYSFPLKCTFKVPFCTVSSNRIIIHQFFMIKYNIFSGFLTFSILSPLFVFNSWTICQLSHPKFNFLNISFLFYI